jgi:hypothetical protein
MSNLLVALVYECIINTSCFEMSLLYIWYKNVVLMTNLPLEEEDEESKKINSSN